MFKSEYQGKLCWSNSYILDLNIPPEIERHKDWEPIPESVIKHLLETTQEDALKLLTLLGHFKDTPDRVIFSIKTGDSQVSYGQVARNLLNYFRRFYPSPTFLTAGVKDCILVQDNGKLVGVLMPLSPPPYKLIAKGICYFCHYCQTRTWAFPDGTSDGVGICEMDKWPAPRIRKLNMILRNRSPIRETGASCELWSQR